MKQLFQETMREQIQADIDNPIELTKKPTPKSGWISLIREALGMTSYQLAKRLGCTQSNITALEQREKSETITLKTLGQTAKAMNCRLVYFFVPEKPLNQTIENQARRLARKQLKAVGHSMALEQQGLSHPQTKKQEDALVKELLQGPLKQLWED